MTPIIPRLDIAPFQAPLMTRDGRITAEWQRWVTELLDVLNRIVDKINTL